MPQNVDLSGQTALVTGASQGIGLATAKALAEHGATVVLAARSAEKIVTEASHLRDLGFKAHSIVCDVSNYHSCASAVEFAVNETGRLDILINNAGVIDPLSTLVDSDPETWGLAADINYKGTYYCMRAAIPEMLKLGHGTVINMSSGAANSALVGWSHYCSSKAAAKKLTEVAHKELSEKSIRVIGLSPGTVATPMMRKIKDANINPVSNLSWDTHIQPEWVGEAVVFLCGEGGSEFVGTDFSLKTNEGRKRLGLPLIDTP